MPKETRSLEFSIAIQATPEEVWKALTEGESITRWFAPEARVTPALGGTVWLSWGPGMEGEGPITVWEPGRRFAWTERADSDSPRVVEFTIDAVDGGKTILRLVQSGFGIDASFDTEYDSTSGGWQSFLQLLRLDLEAHRGQAGRQVFRLLMVSGERQAIQEKLLRAMEFQRDGERYAARLPDGTSISGRVLFERTPGYLMLTLEAPLAGALGLFIENWGEQSALTTSWYLKGAATERAEAIGAAWDRVLATIE
ncbi:MAG: SRPBCC domain-containing protein [Bryobacteraceae bacterium]